MSNSTHSITCITLLQLNTGQLGVSATGRDLKVERVWLQGITGCDSVVAIVDDGEVYHCVPTVFAVQLIA